jgi:fatty acid desaturase
MSAIAIDSPEEERHEPHWITRIAFPIVSLTLFTAQGLIFLAVSRELYWAAVPLVLLVSHLMHGQLIAFHEASHGLLRKNRFLNEVDGVLIGMVSLTSFSLYRAAHQTHHMHLSTERDEEFWPFVDPSVPRWQRVLFAIGELTLGLLFTPLVFARTFLRKGSPIRNKRVRRRIWMEWALCATFWIGTIAAVAHFGVWKYYLWMFLAPVVIAGNLQSWRRYIEHVGLTSSTPNGSTRSIVAKGWLGKLVSFSLLHEPYHGVHHLHAGVPHTHLPFYAESLQPRQPGEHPPFPSYTHAFVHLLRSLSDPRVGAQWHNAAR